MIESLAAFAEPNRFRIVELLMAGSHSVNEIGRRLRLNQPQVSKHLRVLKESGVVAVRPNAQQRLYELRPQPFRQWHDWLEQHRRLWDERFLALDQIMEELKAKERKHE